MCFSNNFCFCGLRPNSILMPVFDILSSTNTKFIKIIDNTKKYCKNYWTTNNKKIYWPLRNACLQSVSQSFHEKPDKQRCLLDVYTSVQRTSGCVTFSILRVLITASIALEKCLDVFCVSERNFRLKFSPTFPLPRQRVE